MADAMVERRHSAKFFCHRCNIEFEDILQDYICPYCASGFIEQVENEQEGTGNSADDFSDADMSNLDDSDDVSQSASHPVLSDLAFLMSGGQVRRRPPPPDSFLEQLMFTIAGGSDAVGGGAVTAGAPFVLVGAPGDYVFGGEGLDAVVTQLLGQLENAGPPPLSRDQIASIPNEDVSQEQAAANTSCSVCWENFLQGEKVSRLECDHVFHTACIEPWLRLHATCPICRRPLLVEDVQTTNAPPPAEPPQPDTTTLSRVLLRRLVSGNPGQTFENPADSSSSTTSMSTASSVTTGGVWAANTRSSNSTSSNSNSSTSLNSSNDRNLQFNMDIDFD